MPLTLYQAEWCPFSSAVRELLTELGLDFVAKQVEPWPEQRDALRERAGTDEIPVLESEDGQIVAGTRAILAFLANREPWPHAADHRERYLEHEDARRTDATRRVLERYGPSLS